MSANDDNSQNPVNKPKVRYILKHFPYFKLLISYNILLSQKRLDPNLSTCGLSVTSRNGSVVIAVTFTQLTAI